MSISTIFRKRLAKQLGRAHRGMTLLEIMIVLAILALVMGLVVGPRVMKAFSKSKNDIAGLATKKFATEAYPLWQTNHAGKQCPDKIDDLFDWADSKDGKDPWGTPYTMTCGGDAPAAAKGFGVVSAGEDMKPGTPDDIKSWEQ
jgi:prepilin-type N-terminal cleavage/methylation domain-containing protein